MLAEVPRQVTFLLVCFLVTRKRSQPSEHCFDPMSKSHTGQGWTYGCMHDDQQEGGGLVPRKLQVDSGRSMQRRAGAAPWLSAQMGGPLGLCVSRPGVLVCSGCHNKIPQTGWLRKCICFLQDRDVDRSGFSEGLSPRPLPCVPTSLADPCVSSLSSYKDTS